MKILHTADWHMNETLGPQDRRDDICRALRQIAVYLDEHQVDVMLVAGDLFCERSRAAQIRDAVADIKEIFGEWLAKGGTMVAISGNHDSEDFFETLRDALDLVATGRPDPNGNHATGRLYVAPRPRLLRLAGRDGQVVQFALMPYPTPRYLRGEANITYSTIEERNRLVRQRFLGTLTALRSGEDFDPRLPSVLVSHIHVRGAQAHPIYRLSEVDDVILDVVDIPLEWSYLAYGHVHKPQAAVAGAGHARYAGSIERLDLGEAEDEKSVVLCEIAGNQRVGDPTTLPLKSTPIYRIAIAPMSCPSTAQALPLKSTPIYRIAIEDLDADLSQLTARYADAAEALVSYTLHWDPSRHNRDALCRTINQVFPRWFSRDFREIGAPTGDEPATTAHDLRDVAGTVRDYLQTRLADHPQKDDLLALAESLLAQEQKVHA